MLTGTLNGDFLFGFGGNDTIDAGAGNDFIFTGRGDDVIRGGEGSDFISGGRGFDTVTYEGSVRDYNISQRGWLFPTVSVALLDDTGAVVETDTLKSVEAITFEADNFTLFLDGRNNAVLADDDTATTGENEVAEIAAADLLANDIDFDGDDIQIVSVDGSSAAGGTVSFDGVTVTYDPVAVFDALAEGETATDTFTYIVDDGQGGLDTATVTVTITGANDAPEIAAEVAVQVAENSTMVPANIMATDVEGDALTFSITGGADASLFQIDPTTGALSFVAAPDFEAPGDADGDNIYTVTVAVTDENGAVAEETIDVTVTDVDEAPVNPARINEVHYDNAGGDEGEFIEIRVEAGSDVSALSVELYNGANGEVYRTVDVSTGTQTTDGTFDYYVLDIAGIQNGAADGIALIDGGDVVEFLSYEGTLTAENGTAAGQTSTDIGQSEGSGTPIGFSLQRGEGDTWDAPREDTRGQANDAEPQPLVINELAVSTSGTDWEFVELFGDPGTSLDGFSLIQVSGENPGEVLSVIDLSGQSIGDNGFFLAASDQAQSTFGVTGDENFADNTLENTPSTFILVENFDGAAGDDLDPGNSGTLDLGAGTVQDSVALVDDTNPTVYSDVVIGPDGTFLAPGAARSEDGAGEFEITPFGDDTGYSPTAGGTGSGGGEPTQVLISQIQGEGDASALIGEQVSVTAIVTYVDEDGYFIQEEDADADGNAATSEGVFVFTGRGNTGDIAVGDQVTVVGRVDEFNGETQINNASATVLASDQELPTAAAVLLSPNITQADYEAVEGMRVSVTSGTEDAMTVIENFELGRYGQITISAGSQTQPTQLFDAETQADEVAALAEDNANNRLVLEDGVRAQNPDGFEYIPVTADEGDNGNGFLDAGDDFSAGATLRLGTEIIEAVEGVMTFTDNGGGTNAEFRVIVEDQITIDPDTNSGAREATPEDVGGDLQVASVNVLNYFTTLNDGSQTGPDGDLNPRGARTAEDLERQTDKLADQLVTTGAEVLALQELENNGFGADGAISTLVDAMNAEAAGRGLDVDYQFVDPTGGVGDGFIGTDAITTGIVYDANAVTLVYADSYVFDEASAQATLDIAEILNPYSPPDDQVLDLQRNRPATVATFQCNETGEFFTVSSLHNKSKGDSDLQDVVDNALAALANGDVPPDQVAIVEQAIADLQADPNFDQGDGQAYWNAVRTDASEEITAFLENEYLPVASAAVGQDVSENVLIMGDFNAYAQEDPTQSIRDEGGYVDVIDEFVEGGQEDAFSFVFDGQQGTLDQAFASDGLADNITGATEWNVNAPEPGLLGYSTRFDDPGFYSDDVYRAADHDPLIVGLDLDPGLTV